MKRYLEYYENEWPENIAELRAIENKPFVGYLNGKEVLYTVVPEPNVYDPYVTFTALEENCSIGFYNDPNSSVNPTIEYSFDKKNWNTLTDNVTVENGSNMYCRGSNPGGISGGYGESGYNYFTGQGKFNVSGDIMSLIDYENMPETMVGTFYNLFGGNIDTSREDFVDIVDASNLILSAKILTADCYQRMFSACTSMTQGPQIKAEVLAPYCCWGMFIECTSLTTAPELPATELTDSCYNTMFAGCSSLITAPKLPAITLAVSCYSSMFAGCISLTEAPELPATTLAEACYNCMFMECNSLTVAPELPATMLTDYCYSQMFQGCTSLTTAPVLPATELAAECYYSMFAGCISLTEAPELPVTTLAESCYGNMFFYCTALTAAPELPATTLAEWCYSHMFDNCTSIVAAPELPATELSEACYNGMFEGCTSLTVAPELPVTTLVEWCYGGMFSNCTSLTKAPELPATTLATHCYSGMFSGCASLTASPKLPVTTLAIGCYNGMFSDCTSLTVAPELPATTLVHDCYAGMFSNCTSLTTAPELPATELADYCSRNMFEDCTNLNYIKCLATDISAYRCTDSWVNNVSPTGTFVKHPDMNSWTTGYDGIPFGWVVIDAENEVEEDVEDVVLEEYPTEYTDIDLGLPSGTLWVNKNLGSQQPDSEGLWFNYGDVEGRTTQHILENGYPSDKAFNKYGDNASLLIEDDPAYNLLGENYLTAEASSYYNRDNEWVENDFLELFNNTDIYIRNNNSVYGPYFYEEYTISNDYLNRTYGKIVTDTEILNDDLVSIIFVKRNTAFKYGFRKNYIEIPFVGEWDSSIGDFSFLSNFNNVDEPLINKGKVIILPSSYSYHGGVRSVIRIVNQDGSILIGGGKSGSYTYNRTYPFQIRAIKRTSSEEYGEVDLGLSVKWADRNVGAETPQDNGLYFSWGNVDGHTVDENGNVVDGYSFDSDTYSTTLGGQYTANKLDAEHDAATVNMGSDWRMPTVDETKELVQNTDHYYIGEDDSIVAESELNYSTKLRSICFVKKGEEFDYNIRSNFIEIPFAGDCRDSLLGGKGSEGYVWSSSLNEYSFFSGHLLSFDKYGFLSGNNGNSRYYGNQVRGVR